MLDLLSLALGFVLVALVAGNNLSVCSGSIIASRVTSRRFGVLVTILGYVLGVVLQGNLMAATISAILPTGSPTYIYAALAIAIVIFIVSQIGRIPQSLSITLTMTLVGMDIASGSPINWGFMLNVAYFWVLIPFLSLGMVVLIMGALRSRGEIKHIWQEAKVVKALLIITSFFVAFTLGANTLGLIDKLLPAGLYNTATTVVAIVLGSVLLSGSTLRRVGSDIIPLRYVNALSTQLVSVVLVEFATLFSIPLSNTQTFISSVYGAGLSYRNRIIMTKPFIAMVSMWLITALVGLAAGLAFGYIA